MGLYGNQWVQESYLTENIKFKEKKSSIKFKGINVTIRGTDKNNNVYLKDDIEILEKEYSKILEEGIEKVLIKKPEIKAIYKTTNNIIKNIEIINVLYINETKPSFQLYYKLKENEEYKYGLLILLDIEDETVILRYSSISKMRKIKGYLIR